MVDYSRWDKLDLSDEESDGGNKPRVRAFNGPQKVTIGGPGSKGQVHVRPSEEKAQEEQADASDDEPMEPPDEDFDDRGDDEDHREDVLQLRALAERSLRAGDPAEAVRLLEKAMKAGGSSCPGVEDVLASARRQLQQKQAASAESAAQQQSSASTSGGSGRGAAQANGGTVADRYSWSQTRETVEVNAFVPDGTKAKAVAVTVSEARVTITVGGSCLLEGEWEFKIAPEEDPDWEVRDLDGRRVVRLTVRKADMPGNLSIVVWWKRLLKGDPEIELHNIEGRKKEQAESFAKAWEEAHVRFREKAQSRTPIPIDVTGGGCAGEDADMQTT